MENPWKTQHTRASSTGVLWDIAPISPELACDFYTHGNCHGEARATTGIHIENLLIHFHLIEMKFTVTLSRPGLHVLVFGLSVVGVESSVRITKDSTAFRAASQPSNTKYEPFATCD